MSRFSPYQYWTRTQLAEQLTSLSFALNMSKEIRHLIEEAINSKDWDPLMDFDGCTIVQDMYHPCISCFLHDYLAQTGQGGAENDELFYYLMLEEGLKDSKAKRRWFGVRVGWIFWLKWKSINKRNLKPYGGHFLTTLDKLRIKYNTK